MDPIVNNLHSSFIFCLNNGILYFDIPAVLVTACLLCAARSVQLELGDRLLSWWVSLLLLLC